MQSDGGGIGIKSTAHSTAAPGIWRSAAFGAAAALGGLGAASALGMQAPWWAPALAAVLVAGAACLRAPVVQAPAPPAARPEPPLDLSAITDALGRAAEGDLSVRVMPLPDDPRARAAALQLNRLLDVGDAFLRQTGDALGHLRQGRTPPRVPTHAFQGDFARMAAAMNDATADASRRRDGFRTLTAGFEGRVIAAADAVAAAATALKASTSGLAGSAAQAKARAHAVTDAARQAAGAAQALDTAARAIAPGADPAPLRSAAADARAAAAAIGALTGAAARIEKVMHKIKRVSDFSRMLAVNASVEAARAGEAGKGFAVVAAEVQSLADQSAAATREARDEIRAVQEGLDLAAKAAEVAAAAAGLLVDAQDAPANGDALSALQAGVADAARRSGATVDAADHADADAADLAAKDLSAAARRLSEHAADLRLELEGYLADAAAA